MYFLLFQIERFYMYFLLFWLLEIRCELLSNPLLVQLELVLASQLFLIAGLKYWGPEIFIKGFVKCAKDQILSAQTRRKFATKPKNKRSIILALLLRNLVIITYRWGSTIDKVSLQPGVTATGQELCTLIIFYKERLKGTIFMTSQIFWKHKERTSHFSKN